HFRKAVEINSKYLDPYCQIAANLCKQGKWAEGLTVCDETLEIDPDNAQPHFLRAIALFGVNRREESIREFRIAIEKKPGMELAHNNLAEVLRRNKQYDEALAECRTALELNPEMPEGHRTM